MFTKPEIKKKVWKIKKNIRQKVAKKKLQTNLKFM